MFILRIAVPEQVEVAQQVVELEEQQALVTAEERRPGLVVGGEEGVREAAEDSTTPVCAPT